MYRDQNSEKDFNQLPRTICIANQKGGVGKTTTAVNLASGFARAGERTLVIDLDPQCNATGALGGAPSARHPLLSAEPLSTHVLETDLRDLFLLPGCRSFQDVNLLEHGEVAQSDILQRNIEIGTGNFDCVLIDCPPSLGQLTRAALASSTEVLMPIQCEYFAMEGAAQMIQAIKQCIDQTAGKLKIGGVLLTMYDISLELTHEVDNEIREFFGDFVFDTVIPRDVAIAEAPSFGKSVLDYAPRSRGSRAYIELCMEVLERD